MRDYSSPFQDIKEIKQETKENDYNITRVFNLLAFFKILNFNRLITAEIYYAWKTVLID